MTTSPSPSIPTVSGVPVLYADKHLIALDKPAGLLSVPGIGPEKADCLAGRVQTVCPDARIVHRLDQATSGVIVMALDAETHRRLGWQFEHRQVDKTYLAVVAGRVATDDGEIDLPLRCDIDNRPHQIVDHVHGKAAQTRYRVLERFDDRTRLELRPLTGRSHQLRVHLQTLGHPILGDDLYAPPADRDRAERLLLHAAELVITHPVTNERMAFAAPCPF